MTNSTDAANSGNPGNMGGSERLAPHGGCWREGCEICNPHSNRANEATRTDTPIPSKPLRGYRKSIEAVKQANDGKLRDWRTSDDMSEFVTTYWGNMQIDPNQVQVGDVLLAALKEDVVIGSTRNRLIARYGTMTVLTPQECNNQEIPHGMSVCTDCIRGSWLWDYLFRNTREMSGFCHGYPRGYDAYGCRCDPCTRAHRAYLADTTRPYSPV
jgi:hypothetical protein